MTSVSCSEARRVGFLMVRLNSRPLCGMAGVSRRRSFPSKEKTGFKISKSKISDLKSLAIPGTIKIHNKELLVASTDGFIEVLELQMQGKKRMEAKSLLNGYTFEDGAAFELISLD